MLGSLEYMGVSPNVGGYSGLERPGGNLGSEAGREGAGWLSGVVRGGAGLATALLPHDSQGMHQELGDIKTITVSVGP